MLSVLLVVLAAEAVTVEVEPRAPVDEAPRTFVNLRGGASSGTDRVYVCGEVAPLSFLSLEGCGTGSGIWHTASGAELAHFRGKVRLGAYRLSGITIMPFFSAGFAELQLGADAAGFRFSDAGVRGVETAGPEAGAAVRAVWSMTRELELLGELSAGAAWMPAADELVRPQDTFQPSLELTVGVGF